MGPNCTRFPLFHFFSGIGNLKKWSDLPTILKKDKKKVLAADGKGVNLIESIIRCLWEEYDILVTYDQLVSFLATEICSKPEYTRYMKTPLSQDDINYNFLAFNKKNEYSRLVADLYLPAISNALDMHLRVIQNIAGYYGIMNTYPLPNDFNPMQKKTITLIVIDDSYHPVVSVPSGVPSRFQTVQAISQSRSDGMVEKEASPSEEEENPKERTRKRKRKRNRNGNKTNNSNKSIFLVEEVILISSTDDEGPPPPDTSIATPEPANSQPVKEEQGCDDDILPPCPEVQILEGKKPFDMRCFWGMIPEVVAKVPHNIDGLKFYLIDVPEEEPFFSKYKDGRYFEMHSSSRKGFKGVRRVGKCRGSFICTNKCCPLFVESGKENQHQFTTIGKNKFCYSCNALVHRKPCPAIKLIEYNMQGRLLEVYHKGHHTCQVKPNSDEHDKVIEENIRRFGANVGPKDLAQMKMTEELKKQLDSQDFDMEKIVEIAATMSDKKRIQNIKGKIQQELKSERHSISAVAELKLCTDTADNYLIYQIHDQNMSGSGISFIFKSSKRMANLMINMDQDQPLDSPLKEEPVYFDGMHKRCVGWKTLTSWVYHMASRKLMRLATCEVKGETSESCAQFWKLVNQMLREVTKKKNYKFNPKYFIVDEAGANFNGIQEVFGEEGVRKTKTCKFHFQQSLQRMLMKFTPDLLMLRNEFEELMTTLLNVSTLKEYKDVKFRLEQVAAVLPSLQHQLEWWFARRYNLFPIFRGYCISSVNLAEIGHSTLKRAKPIALVDAAWEDTCTMILQEQEHTKFLAGRAYSTGKGPSAGSIAENEKRQQMRRSRDYQRAFIEQNFDMADEDRMFLPGKRAKHRHPELPAATVEGREQIATAVEDATASGSGNATATARPMPLQPKKVNTNGENTPLLCFLQGFKISICYGCKNKFTPQQKKTPDDLIIKMQVKRDRLINEKWVSGWKNSWAYFHLNINCLKLVNGFIEIEDIYIPNDIRGALTPAHINKLEKMGWWSKMKMRY